MDVAELVARFSAAAKEPQPHDAVVRELEGLKSNLGAIAEATSYILGSGGNAHQAFYRAPDLSLLKVRFPAGRRTPPHNHGTWAVILLLAGAEKNYLYKRDGEGSLIFEKSVELRPGDILHMPEDAVHVAECMGAQEALGLHIYGGNVLEMQRSMWDPETVREEPLDWSKYESLAQRASAARAAPLSS